MNGAQAVEAFPPASYLAEEMEARGWGAADVAARMGGETAYERGLDLLVIEMMLALGHRDNVLTDDKTCHKLARAFGTSPEFWLNLEKYWREWRAANSNRALVADEDQPA